MHPLIRERKQDLDELLEEDMTIPDEVVQSCRAELQRVSDELLAVTEANARERYIRDYLNREHRRAAASSADDLPAGEEPRERPLCTCHDPYCAIKSGQLPPEVRQADDPVRGVDQFRERHPRPPVLIEASEAYRQAQATVLAALEDCVTAAQRKQPLDEVRESPPERPEVKA